MPLSRWIVNPILNGFTSMICRIDVSQLAHVPMAGPLILATNHVNFLEIPILYTRLGARPVTVFAKQESWNSPLIRLLFDLTFAIPVRRGEVDTVALRRAIEILKAGRILALAPEGTRSGTGQLQQAHPGIVMIAQRSGAPLQPLAFYGYENYRHNLRHFRRTDFRVAVGQPFCLKLDGVKISSEVRQQIADEIMYQVAALLPPKYRGYYSYLETATERYLQFSAPSHSNLRTVRE